MVAACPSATPRTAYFAKIGGLAAHTAPRPARSDSALPLTPPHAGHSGGLQGFNPVGSLMVVRDGEAMISRGAAMSEPFDPYYVWLGIRPEEQPANYYRLLGIAVFEDNHEVISDAADQRMAHVRTKQLSQHAESSQTILNQIAAAKISLLSPEEKAAYDDWLRPTIRAREAPVEHPPVNHPTPPAVHVTARRAMIARQERGRIVVVGITIVLLAGVLVLWMWSLQGKRGALAGAERKAGTAISAVRPISMRHAPLEPLAGPSVRQRESETPAKPEPTTGTPPSEPETPTGPEKPPNPAASSTAPGLDQPRDQIPTGRVRIVNRGSRLHLSSAKSTLSGTEIIQIQRRRGDNGKLLPGLWEVEPVRNLYKIRNDYSGLFLAIANGSPKSGTDVCQMPDTGRASTLWKFEPLVDGFWAITNQDSGLCLESSGDANRSPVKQAPRREGDRCQEWRFESAQTP